ncbi:MAG: hypothetical protein AAGL29_14280, partial [Bacteroidota bacterium]
MDTITYDDFYQIYMDSDKDYQNHYSHLHLNKAKKERDTFQIIQAYRMKSWNQGFKEGMASIDTALQWHSCLRNIPIKKSLELEALLIHARAKILYQNDSLVQTAKECARVWSYSNEIENAILTSGSLSALASIKSHFGQEKEGLRLSQRVLRHLSSKKNEFSHFQYHLLRAYTSLARAYALDMQLDSAQYFVDISLSIAKREKQSSIEVMDLRVLQAKVNYYQGEFQKCLDTLKRYAKVSIQDEDDFYYL